MAMNMRIVGILVLAVAACLTPVPCGAGNAEQIALLRWYGTNLSAAFPTGNHPYGVTFDGANIWVGNSDDGTVMKYRASDGTLLGTFPAGDRPGMLAFDGASVWVANSDGLTVLRASDGSLLSSSPMPAYALAFIGGGMLVSNGTSISGLPVTFDGGAGLMAFDGTSVWVTNPYGGAVTKVRTLDDHVLGRFKVGPSPQAIAFDGTNMWVATQDDCTVTKLRLGDGAPLAIRRLPYGCDLGVNMVFDGSNIWVSHGTGTLGSYLRSFITRIKASSGQILATDGYEQFRDSTLGMMSFDGANVWVTQTPFGLSPGRVLKR